MAVTITYSFCKDDSSVFRSVFNTFIWLFRESEVIRDAVKSSSVATNIRLQHGDMFFTVMSVSLDEAVIEFDSESDWMIFELAMA